MNDLNSILSKVTAASKELLKFMSTHRILIVFLVSSVAIMLALVQTRSYLNPSRDEAIYIELSTGINYNGIDDVIVKKLQSTQNDKEIQVNANLVPDRSNPFNE